MYFNQWRHRSFPECETVKKHASHKLSYPRRRSGVQAQIFVGFDRQHFGTSIGFGCRHPFSLVASGGASGDGFRQARRLEYQAGENESLIVALNLGHKFVFIAKLICYNIFYCLVSVAHNCVLWDSRSIVLTYGTPILLSIGYRCLMNGDGSSARGLWRRIAGRPGRTVVPCRDARHPIL